MSVFDNQYQNQLYNTRDSQIAGRFGNEKPRMFFSGTMYFDLDGHNKIITTWASKVSRELKKSAAWFSDGKDKPFVMRGPQREGKLAQSIETKIKKEFGAIDRLTYNFERHGVFVHKGVGRGYVASGSFVRRIASGDQKKPRVAVEWFNPILDKHVPELANRLADIDANIAVNATLMHIR
jgi:hypothetical protein